jgi:hypothetical protein
MVTPSQRAKAVCENLNLPLSGVAFVVISAAMSEQSRDVRHACAEAVIGCPVVCETPNGNDAISPDDAHDACMNLRT